jgi:segregation and condensation protein A
MNYEEEMNELQSETTMPENGETAVNAENAEEFESSGEYKIKLDNFEGPLDLLLHLIRAAKVEIKDIFVSKVTEQFLEYIADLEGVDIDKAGEYMQMAATLLEIKSRAILPKLDEYDDLIDDGYDPEQELIRKLEEYKLYKEASEKLKLQENVNSFYKEPEPAWDDVRVVYSDFNFNNLMKAFEKMLYRASVAAAKAPPPKEIIKDEFTVNDKIIFIKETVSEKKQVSFFDLFGETVTRSEVITTFQALLELLKMQFIKVVQAKIFGDIDITLNENYVEGAEDHE